MVAGMLGRAPSSDVVVVGSGPTGVIAAWALVQRGVSVALLESGYTYTGGLHLRWRGQDYSRRSSLSLWDDDPYPEFVNQGDCQARWVKAHRLGGLANFWGGVTLRCAPSDFDGEGVYQWPLSYAELEPFYEEVEKLLYIKGSATSEPALPACAVKETLTVAPEFLPLLEACKKFQRSLAPLPYIDGPPTWLCRTASKRNFVIPLLKQLKRRRNFRLISKAHVSQVLPHPIEKKVKGVEYIDRQTGSLHRIDAEAVILAAGSLASAQILLNSQSSIFPDGIGNDQGLVGAYLHDNPLAYINCVVDADLPYLDGSEGGLYLTRQIERNQERPIAYQVYSGWAARFHPNLRADLRDPLGAEPHLGKALVFSCYTTQTPWSKQSLKLDALAKDQYGLPLIHLDVSFDSEDLARLERGREIVEGLLRQTGWNYEVSDFEPQPPGSSVHYGGAVRMHHDPHYGALDGLNRCHEAPNLLVVDASCFTNSIEKNPTLTAMAIAMRAASLLKL